MKRLIALALVVLASQPVLARAGGLGVGVFGGESYPVLQDDTGNGTLVGVRVPLKLVPFVTIEPWYASSSLSDKVTSVAGLDYTRQGFDEKIYGVNAMFATGGPLSFYPIVGIGQASLKRAGYDQTLTSYNAGIGIGISPLPKFSIDLRAEAQAVVDGQTTRKFGNATAGVTYHLLGLPGLP